MLKRNFRGPLVRVSGIGEGMKERRIIDRTNEEQNSNMWPKDIALSIKISLFSRVKKYPNLHSNH